MGFVRPEEVARARKATKPVFERTAQVLERSADLADEHAEWGRPSGRPDVAREERRRANWARDAARRARSLAARR